MPGHVMRVVLPVGDEVVASLTGPLARLSFSSTHPDVTPLSLVDLMSTNCRLSV